MQSKETSVPLPGLQINGARLLNTEPGPPTHKASEDFINLINDQRQKGFGFVPFIGAGFSAPSGVPLVWELKAYLVRCICMALGAEQHGMRPWNPRTDQWPPFIDRSRPEPPEFWKEKVRSELKYRTERGVYGQEVSIFEEALGAMAEWRASLAFLSRLVRENRGTGDLGRTIVSLDAPRQEIVDACLREVLKGRYPTLGHRMLAGLAGALRLDLVLTTNFDDLLESAFAAARNPLEVLDVPLGGNLPHWSAVSNVRSLIKLHGSRYSLRADYSLDAVPSETDKQRFLEYLLSGKSRDVFAKDSGSKNLKFQNHLLVMGFSANDRRIRSLLEHAWIHLDKEFRVFWVCYTEEDVTQFREFVADCLDRRILRAKEEAISKGETISKGNVAESESGWEGAWILRHADHGLLLLQAYQQIRRNLPPLGSPFPSVSRLTLPPQPSEYITEALHAKNGGNPAQTAPPVTAGSTTASTPGRRAAKVVAQSKSDSGTARLGAKTQPEMPETADASTGAAAKRSFAADMRLRLQRFDESGNRHKLIVAMSAEAVGGVTTACANVFQELASDHVCLWLDMNDISSTGNLFEALLEAAYVRIGLEHWTPAHSSDDARSRANEIKRLVNSVSSPWVIFLNARETPGANTEEKHDPDNYPNGWLDNSVTRGNDDPSDTAQKFVELLVELCGPSSPRLSVVLLCRKSDPPGSLLETLAQNNLQDQFLELIPSFSESVVFREADIVKAALEWPRKDDEKENLSAEEKEKLRVAKERFLLAIVLTQRPRLLAAIWSRAFSCETNEHQDGVRSGWIGDLQKLGLVRRKPGGFIWVHSRCRQALRDLLKKHWEQSGRSLKTRESEVHKDLADWYSRVLDASEAPAALFEIVYHQCLAAKTRLEQHNAGVEDGVWACERLDAASALLKSQSFLIQTHGYSRGSCRRLEHISSSLCPSIFRSLSSKYSEKEKIALANSLIRLRLVSVEIMRAIAREVGEDKKAYDRHKQFGKFVFFGRLLLDPGPKLEENKPDEEKLSSRLASRFRGKDRPKTDWISSPRAEWVRWWRWSGMLGIASRSFGPAKRALKKAIYYAVNDDKVYPPKLREPEWDQIAALMATGTLPSEIQQLRIEALRSMELYISLRLLEFSVQSRLAGLPGKKRKEADSKLYDRTLRDIERRIAAGQDLAKLIRGADHSFDSHNAARAVRYQGRLLMHMSVCAARRIKLPGTKKELMMQPPMALLGDAEACLTITASPQDRSELAMIELHRAEVRIHEAEAVVVAKDGSETRFAKMCRKLEEEPFTTSLWRAEGRRLREEFEKHYDPTALRRAGSLVNDGIRFLNRAEPALRERRRNVWWTTWFFERRLRAISYSIWTSIFETATPIPFLGLEASMRKTDTVADLVLGDSIRMTRTDPYRLATIIDAYFSCAKALQFRLMFEPPPDTIHERQKAMYNNLIAALGELDRVYKARTEKYREKNSRLDPATNDYIVAVRERCLRKAAELKAPFE
jgi:hypothetical protein